jgi:tetratricopeptide (TPR) repeat protein
MFRRLLSLRLVFTAFMFGCFSFFALAQESPSQKTDPEKQHAFELFQSGKFLEAMPLFEKLTVDHPNDAGAWEGWGASVLAYSQTLNEPELRKKGRAKARTILVKAQGLGDNSFLIQSLLSIIPEDGGEMTFSKREDVDKVMQQAEASFAKGDYDQARSLYLQALLLDPKLYEAALFIGDVFYRQQQPGSAGEWYARAIQIDPDRETAYRYWGDVLVSQGKMDEARSKIIEAVIAEPYTRTAWLGAAQWAQQNHLALTILRFKGESAVSVKDGKVNINVDPESLVKKKDASTEAWILYGGLRAAWQKQRFAEHFPKESSYRHTMAEETDCLHTMASLVAKNHTAKEIDESDPGLNTLIKIDHEGLLEPYVLMNRADDGIVQDYAAYRTANRQKLNQYLDEFVVPKTPAKSAQ